VPGAAAADARLPAVPDPITPEALDPAVRRVVEAAARKGVDLRVVVLEATTHTAEDAARALGAELGQIVKSLIFVAPREEAGHEPVLCLVSGTNRVDVARLAAVVGEPGIRRATAREARDLTGYAIGGIPPVGHAHGIRVVMDPDLGRFGEVWAAAGADRAVFPIGPAALRALANAVVAPIADPAAAPGPEPVEPASTRDGPSRDAGRPAPGAGG
jgi:prolyl-tRNA editing enzyme YbaK/EbsC (Cys-tRNA(Pro) deacylase)